MGKRGKRGQNEGSVYQLPSGKFRAQVTLPGGRKTKTFTRQKDAIAWKNEMLDLVNKGLTADSTRMTFEVFIQEWLESKKRSRRPRTIDHYQQLIRDYLIPTLGQMMLTDIKPSHIDQAYRKLTEMGISQWVLVKTHAILRTALQYAYHSGITVRNAAAHVAAPRGPHYEIEVLDEAQVGRLLVTAKGNRLEALFYVAVVTGMRQSEILGLRWKDIDWENNVIQVRYQLGRNRELAPLKTAYAKRNLTMTPADMKVLLAHEARQQDERRFYGWEAEPEYVFVNTAGKPLHFRRVVRIFKPLLQAAGLPDVHFHALRHSNATILLSKAIPLIVVSRRLGHSRPSITLDMYGHLLPQYQKEAAEMMNQIIPVVLEDVDLSK